MHIGIPLPLGPRKKRLKWNSSMSIEECKVCLYSCMWLYVQQRFQKQLHSVIASYSYLLLVYILIHMDTAIYIIQINRSWWCRVWIVTCILSSFEIPPQRIYFPRIDQVTIKITITTAVVVVVGVVAGWRLPSCVQLSRLIRVCPTFRITIIIIWMIMIIVIIQRVKVSV